MADELDPLAPLAEDLKSAFDAERRRADVDDAMRARLLGRVLGTVAVGAAVTAAAGTASAAGAGAATGAGAGAGAGVAGVGLLKMAPWLFAAFLLGGGAGAMIHAAVTSKDLPVATPPIPAPPASSARVEPSAAPSESVAAVSVSSLPSARTAPPPLPTTTTSSAPSVDPAGAGRDVDLASERALVDRARTALTRGQSAAALDALDAHAKSFPRGRLAEEREALAVDALARAGRTVDAHARAEKFRATWPNSVFGGLVDAASPRR